MNDMIEQVKNDPYAKFLGVNVDCIESGFSRCSLVIEDHMLNFAGFPHGGLIFSLADIAFAGAAASVHLPTTALNVSCSFCGTATVGKKLVSEARRTHESRRFSYFNIVVMCEDRLLASLQGTAYKIKDKQLVE